MLIVMSLAALLVLSACAKINLLKTERPLPDVAKSDLERVQLQAGKKLTFNDVKPVLENRCVVCHGCYDAPCQLKLTSFEGLTRGANKFNVYRELHFSYQQPTRLFIDANTTQEWREKDFFGVLNEGNEDSPEANLKHSLLYQMLQLKRRNPLPEFGKLPGKLETSDFLDVSLDREQVCAGLDEMGDFAKDHPLWGMPYAVPNLSNQEYNLLVQWLAQGAKNSDAVELSLESKQQITMWETFFNSQKSNKEILANRYIYEHLVLAHLHFKGAPEQEFFRLVRSRTQTGEIDEIPAVRAYDDPKGIFYYRLRPYVASIVDKNHIVYELSDTRMARYKELFLEPDYQVATLPPYNPGESTDFTNRSAAKVAKFIGMYDSKMLTPFMIFDAIPPKSRYQFLLDDARFFINGFIKGPVCRGQGALSSVEDQFWVFFLRPESPRGFKQHGLDRDFLKSKEQLLHLPTELADTSRLLTAWLTYWPQQQKYMQAKLGYYQKLDKAKKLFPIKLETALDAFIWDGKQSDGSYNPNAALTVFRHLDSASAHYGLHGDEPETAWIIDYPIFERLHYLLVAGYNRFGSIGHQASARLYMDFLRMEGEDNFLFFLPVDKRRQLYASWHEVDRATTPMPTKATRSWLNVHSVSGYQSHKPQHELYLKLREHVGFKSPDSKDLNRCKGKDCFQASERDRLMQKLAHMRGKTSLDGNDYYPLQYFPSTSYVRIGGAGGSVYTMIYNKSYKLHQKGSFLKKVTKPTKADMSSDSLTILKGIAGSYPNFFFDLNDNEALKNFVDSCLGIKNQEGYDAIVESYGIRRTNPKFWKVADWFQNHHTVEQREQSMRLNQPVETGILDLSRYKDS